MRTAAWVAVMATALMGCGGTDSGGGGGDPIVFTDAEVDMAPMQEADPLADYCQARAEALCGWAFECTGGGGTLVTFDLPGPALADCVAGHARQCTDDLHDRDARGTLEFSEAGGAACAMALAAAPCPSPSPVDWINDWRRYEEGRCGTVARGLVVTGDPCAIQADCATLDDACVDGVCAPIPAASLVQSCDGGGDLGIAEPDDSCPTGTCVSVTGGALCSASCARGRGCGVGGVCLLASTLGGAIRPYCALACAREGDPTCGELACELLNEGEPDRICAPPR